MIFPSACGSLLISINIQRTKTKTVESVNGVDLDKVAHN